MSKTSQINQTAQLPQHQILMARSQRTQPLILFILVLTSQLYLGILLKIFNTQINQTPKNTNLGFYLCLITISIFTISCIWIGGCNKKIIPFYFKFDFLMLLTISSSLTYVLMNSTRPAYQKNQYNYYSICIPIIIYSMVCNFRIMQEFYKFNKVQNILWKFIKIICSSYSSYCCIQNLWIKSSIFQPPQNIERVLFFFSFALLWAEMFRTKQKTTKNNPIIKQQNIIQHIQLSQTNNQKQPIL